MQRKSQTSFEGPTPGGNRTIQVAGSTIRPFVWKRQRSHSSPWADEMPPPEAWQMLSPRESKQVRLLLTQKNAWLATLRELATKDR
ncbi:hypothetical protein F441_06961 [Phytophthora nicotianae CJ01A1]|uniref:Uncharacterized protein n=6 Tax=Phytophthora nicotianae TaxID=4792 RepID=W2QCU1_PHYN3|nr:hypothetical protein PPTG_22629 [Phytophthora nicotianae INRA-310]ETI49114.1 hypothetical protein F443_06953 [Phytophthora nicotianae P1569]ETK89010.1 hypothetical protein L915_06828 [Phytophthora nicotianae]ETP18867.1 hypothetical protein F441_06961 [Phytophthora nicotianae CJ01A1]ETP46838.1 hypothetical protein F442_06987 [Phytophthora nicotianae P10297]ETN11003.1 hypothetical protein PPTG_22629 [Phytophthora nicotianae INRA-310]